MTEALPLSPSAVAEWIPFAKAAGFFLATFELTERMDAISQKLTSFNIGRYDIRYSSEEDLRAGRNFQIPKPRISTSLCHETVSP